VPAGFEFVQVSRGFSRSPVVFAVVFRRSPNSKMSSSFQSVRIQPDEPFEDRTRIREPPTSLLSVQKQIIRTVDTQLVFDNINVNWHNYVMCLQSSKKYLVSPSGVQQKKSAYRRGRSVIPWDLVVRLALTTSTLLRSLGARVLLLTASFESSTMLSNKRFSS
jgi:hypothetical protein